MNDLSGQGKQSNLDPAMRKRLIEESRSPWRGLRRGLWFACFGSACLGLGVMALRSASGITVPINDLGVQLAAFLVFGGLLILDRSRES